MITIASFIQDFENSPFQPFSLAPWNLPQELPNVLNELLKTLDEAYTQSGTVYIHHTATIEPGVILKGPIIVGPGCFIGAHAYLRGGVYLDDKVSIGPGCEIKSSVIFAQSAAAHFNFIGDSIVGRKVNFEAGAITANHYNERDDKRIFVQKEGKSRDTGVEKFGALIGDGSRIGANAVLSPGTLLERGSVVGRLELVQQNPI